MQEPKITPEQVEALVQRFTDLIEAALNSVDQIAEVNTQTISGIKYIKASKFRMNIRQMKVKLLQDIEKYTGVKNKKPVREEEH